ncbi:MAG: MFS transporter [Thermoleophilia bacterium]
MSALGSRSSGLAAPRHRHLGLALAIISAAQLMVMLDLTIVNVALPSIQRALRFSPANLEWVVTAYVLAFGGLLLLGGRTGDLFGRRRMFIIGLLLFAGASLAGGFATTQAWLIAARAIQGIGAAIASPTALSLVAATFPEGHERNRAMAVYAAMSGAGGALGLLIGGVLTDLVSWRWVLFVNVPIGLVVVLGAFFVLDPQKGRSGRLDLPGAMSATAGAALLVYGLARVADYGWTNTVTIATLVGALLVVAAFVVIEARSPHALVPLRIFTDRNRAGGYAIMFLLGAGMLSLMFFLTQFFQDVLGYSPLRTGVAFLPLPFMVGTMSQVASRLVGRIGTRPLLTVGPLAVAGGLLWMSGVTSGSGYLSVLGPLVMVGFGMGMSFVPLTLSAVAGVPRSESGLASALLNTSQQIGGSLGVALLVTIATTATKSALAALGPAGHGATAAGGAAHHAVSVALASGYDDAFRAGAAIAAAAFVVALLALRRKSGGPGGQEFVASRPTVAEAAAASEMD